VNKEEIREEYFADSCGLPDSRLIVCKGMPLDTIHSFEYVNQVPPGVELMNAEILLDVISQNKELGSFCMQYGKLIASDTEDSWSCMHYAEFWSRLDTCIPNDSEDERRRIYICVLGYLFRKISNLSQKHVQKVHFELSCFGIMRAAIRAEIDVIVLSFIEKVCPAVGVLCVDDELSLTWALLAKCDFDTIKLLSKQRAVGLHRNDRGFSMLHWALLLGRNLEEITYIWSLYTDVVNCATFLCFLGVESQIKKADLSRVNKVKIPVVCPIDYPFYEQFGGEEGILICSNTTPLGLVLDLHMGYQAPRQSIDVIIFLLSKSSQVLLVQDSNSDIPLHKMLKGRYSVQDHKRLLNAFLTEYWQHAYVVAFVRDKNGMIAIEIALKTCLCPEMLIALGQFTNICIDRCVALLVNTKVPCAPGVQRNAKNMRGVVDINVNPLVVSPHGSSSDSGLDFCVAYDGCPSLLAGLACNFLRGGNIEMYDDTGDDQRLFRNNYRLHKQILIPLETRQQYLRDLNLYVSEKNYRNLPQIVTKLHRNVLQWFSAYEIVMRTQHQKESRLRKDDIAKFFIVRPQHFANPLGDLAMQSAAQADKHAAELLASLDQATAHSETAKTDKDAKNARKKQTRKLRAAEEKRAEQELEHQTQSIARTEDCQEFLSDIVVAVMTIVDKNHDEAPAREVVIRSILDDLACILVAKDAVEQCIRPDNTKVLELLVPLLPSLGPSQTEMDMADELATLQDLVRQHKQSMECVVCMDRPKTLIVKPCGHACLCTTCWSEFRKPKLCPICRTPIIKVENLFLN